MARKYIDYLNDKIYYWKKKAEESTNEVDKVRCEMMWESFREKILKEKEKTNNEIL